MRLTQEHERHAEQLEERKRREDVRRIERMASGGVDDERDHAGQRGQGDRDSVIGGPDDQQRADVPVKKRT